MVVNMAKGRPRVTREHRLAVAAAWRDKNRDHIRKLSRESAARARAKNPEKFREAGRRWRARNVGKERAEKYGLTLDAFHRLHAAQDGRCAICREPKPLHIDHDHASGHVRGLLCRRCNVALGYLEAVIFPIGIDVFVRYQFNSIQKEIDKQKAGVSDTAVNGKEH